MSDTSTLIPTYKAMLFDDVVPFWEQHSIDRVCGGYFTRLARNGIPYAEDKDIWMTGRQVWMFSRLFNQVEKRDAWLEIAVHGANFLLKHAFRPNDRMYFRLTRKGEPLAESLSLYSECFTAMAFAELGIAASNPEWSALALKMNHAILPRLGVPSDTPMLGYPLNREFHLHAHDMMRITLAWMFNELSPHEEWISTITMSVESILTKHWKPELGALLENVSPTGEPMLDLPEGRMVHPGHAIESAWMMMEFAKATDNQPLLNKAVEITLRSLERGWDEKLGGIKYLTNLDDSPTHPLEADLKLWWPHCEALYATLLAWKLTQREEMLRWYWKIHDYTFSAFPDPEFGEWFGYLNRDGSPVFSAKANGWKGFFHLPRVLLRCLNTLTPTSAQPLSKPHNA